MSALISRAFKGAALRKPGYERTWRRERASERGRGMLNRIPLITLFGIAGRAGGLDGRWNFQTETWMHFL